VLAVTRRVVARLAVITRRGPLRGSRTSALPEASRAQQHVGLLAARAPCRILRYEKGCSQSPLETAEHTQTSKKKRKNTTLTLSNYKLFIRRFPLSFPFWEKLLHCFWTFAGVLQRNRLWCLTRTKGGSKRGAAQLKAAIRVTHNTLGNYKADNDKVGGK